MKKNGKIDNLLKAFKISNWPPAGPIKIFWCKIIHSFCNFSNLKSLLTALWGGHANLKREEVTINTFYEIYFKGQISGSG